MIVTARERELISLGPIVLLQAIANYAQGPVNGLAWPLGDVMKFLAKSTEREGNAWELGWELIMLSIRSTNAIYKFG